MKYKVRWKDEGAWTGFAVAVGGLVGAGLILLGVDGDAALVVGGSVGATISQVARMLLGFFVLADPALPQVDEKPA